jgi:hypothetical protein
LIDRASFLFTVIEESAVRSNSAGGRSPRALCRRALLNQPRYSTSASSSWERVRQTRSVISSVLSVAKKLSATALMLLCQERDGLGVVEVGDE